MAQLPEPDSVPATVVKHRWVELGRDSMLALNVVYDVNGEEIEGLIWFTEKAQNMGRRGLRSLGFDITDRDPAELDDKPTLLAGAKCNVKLVHESYNGQPRMKADLVIPRDVAVGRGALRSLAEKIKNPPPKQSAPKQDESWMTEPIEPGPTAKPAEKKKPINDDVNFDDIPFAVLFCLTATMLSGILMA